MELKKQSMKKKRSTLKKKYVRNKSTKRVRRGGDYNDIPAGVSVDVQIDRKKMIDDYKKKLAADKLYKKNYFFFDSDSLKKNDLRTKMVQDGFTLEETVPVLGKYWGDKEWKKLSPMMIQSASYKADRGEIRYRLFSKKDAIQNLFFAIAHRFFNDKSIIYLRSQHFSDWYSDGKIPTVEDEINYCITNKINCTNTLHPTFGITPLHLAIMINRISTIVDLEKSIYSSSWTGTNDKTEILLTVEESDEEDKKTVEYLINNGADIDAVDNYGNTPLIYALWREKQPKPITAKYLIEKGANINKCNWLKTTPIVFAVLFSTPEIVQLMIDKGADVKAIDSYGTSVLDYANRKINKDFAAIIQRSIDK
jgi:ankyrin repeat protein